VVDFDIVDRTVRGDLATDIGYYRIRRAGEPEGGGSGGKFIVIWKRDASGGWKIYADGYSEVRGPEGEGQ
jgi:ketosteroid isomerase-like protein